MDNETIRIAPLKRNIDWKQGLASALGAPILILPSIGYFASLLGPSAIIVWILSVIQGSLQNVAYAELATKFPNASGIPGYTQTILSRQKNSRDGLLAFIGGLSAWGYLIGWSFVLSIFTLQIGSYLQKLVPALNSLSEVATSLIIGAVVFSAIFIVNYRGLGKSAKLAYLLAIISLVPLLVITAAPFITGAFHLTNITDHWLPADWNWDIPHILFLLGIFGMAEWSACASEAAAVYGPEYKKPETDLPRALFLCGLICFLTYSSVQTAATGTLGINGILTDRLSPLFPLAQATLGPIGLYIAILMLIAAMVLLIQMSSITASRAMHSMAVQGNLPAVFGRTNKHGTPVTAMIIVFGLNLVLILVRSPEAILAASALGYMLSHAVTLYCFVKTRVDPVLSRVPRQFKAPKGWVYIALFYAVFTFPFCFIGLIFLNSKMIGWTPTWIGLAALALYLPLWLVSRKKIIKAKNR